MLSKKGNTMIKYLNQKEKALTKPLYQEAFFEDSDSFVNYYYEEKLKDNRILADIEGESIRSMMMLNPYKISVFNKVYNLDYIMNVFLGRSMFFVHNSRYYLYYVQTTNVTYWKLFLPNIDLYLFQIFVHH